MLEALKRTLFGHRAQGEPIVIVSGLPRSGTSMLMNMLDAGGQYPGYDPRNAVVVREEDGPYTVPAGRVLVMTAFGGDNEACGL